MGEIRWATCIKMLMTNEKVSVDLHLAQKNFFVLLFIFNHTTRKHVLRPFCLFSAIVVTRQKLRQGHQLLHGRED